MKPKPFASAILIAATIASPPALRTAHADEGEAAAPAPALAPAPRAALALVPAPLDVPPPPRVRISLEAPEEAVLEERVGSFEEREAGWRQLCIMPCQAHATTDPYAQHRVVDGRKTRSVTILGRGGENLVVRYERAPASASLLVGGGVAAAAVGVVLAIGGLAAIASNPGPSYEQLSLCSGNAACESRYHHADADADARRAPGRALAAGGGITALVGAVAIFAGVLTGQSSAHVVRRAAIYQGRF